MDCLMCRGFPLMVMEMFCNEMEVMVIGCREGTKGAWTIYPLTWVVLSYVNFISKTKTS